MTLDTLCFASPVPIPALRASSIQSASRHGRIAVAPARRAARMAIAEGAESPPPAAQSAAPHETDVIIVGSGISGSSLAFTLHRDHPDVQVLMTEARDVVGGNVISRNENGYIWEEGPNTFQPAAHIMRIAVDLGLKDELVLADHTLPRFVYWDEKLFALPLSPSDLPQFRLLSIPGAIRAGLGAAGFVAPKPPKEESIKEFITRHLGAEVFAKMIDPFVSGVYAGDPSKLSMSAAFKKIFALQELGFTLGIVEGAIIRLQQKKKEAGAVDPDLPTWKGGALGSFRKGLSMLPDAVAERLGDSVRLGWKLSSLTQAADGRYVAVYDTPRGKETVLAKSVALTSPAKATASILNELAPEAAALEDIHYPTVWSVTLAYPKKEFREPLKGFGNLIPRSMGIRTLGTIWSSCLFPGRAPEGMELLLSYIGGAQDPSIADLSEEEVVATVHGDIKKILLKDGTEVEPVVVGARKWDRAIPQYNIGYWEIMGKTQEALGKFPGVFLGGNYASGVAFGDCVLWGSETAADVASFVRSAAVKE